MQGKTLYKAADYDFEAAAKKIGLRQSDLAGRGEIDRLLRTGVSSALPMKLKRSDGTTAFESTARLALGADRAGRPEVKIVMRAHELKLDRYRGVEIEKDDAKRLRAGENVLIRDDKNGREYITRVDKELNRVAGWSKSSVMIPSKLRIGEVGEAKLGDVDMANLKRGGAVDTELSGTTFRAQVDPVRRELVLTRSLAQAQKVTPAKLVPEAPVIRRQRSVGVRI